MSVFTTTRTARKTHRCSYCRGQIKPGQRYERHAITPGDDASDGTRWQRAANHLIAECPAAWGEVAEAAIVASIRALGPTCSGCALVESCCRQQGGRCCDLCQHGGEGQ